jgi:hypothetical protein
MAAAVYFSADARRLGMASGIGVALLGAAYGATLAAGLWSLQSPEGPIRDPFFSALETDMSGVAVGDMQVRMIGVVGYACLFPVVALMLAVLFRRTRTITTSIDT